MKLLTSLLLGLTLMQPTYIGNNDFRGFLAANKPEYLAFTGNDGGVNTNDLSNYLGSQGFDIGNEMFMSEGQRINQDIAGLYSQWQGLQNGVPSNYASTGDANTAAYYDDQANQLRGQLGNLDNQQNIGLQNIANSYNLGANRLDEQNAVAKRNYDTSTQQNTRNYLNTRNSVLANTRATANALQRLLGLNGAGFSSAALEQAPYAAGLQGSQNLGQAQNTYSNNAATLDTNWQDTQRGYNNAFEDLNRQKYQQENSLRASIAQTRASLLDKIAGAGVNAGLARGQNYGQAVAARAPYQQQIDSLLSEITNLGNQYANPVLRTVDVSFAAPNLNQYSLGQFAAPTTQQGGAQSDISPTFLNMLTGQRQRDQYGNLIQA